jgi:hypothetical protein
MKKLSVLLVVMAASVSVAVAQGVSVGVRTVSGLQAVAQFHVTSYSYIELRGGVSWLGGPVGNRLWPDDFDHIDDHDDLHYAEYHTGAATADFTALFNWNVANFDWTGGQGNWFLDVGAGLNFGGRQRYSYVGLAGMGRMGYTFEDFPLSLSLDWTPVLGPEFVRYSKSTRTGFYWNGLANVGFTASWKF